VLATSKCSTESTCSQLSLNYRLPPPMGCCGSTANVPPEDLAARSDLMSSVDPLLFPRPLSPTRSRSRTRTQSRSTQQSTRTRTGTQSTQQSTRTRTGTQSTQQSTRTRTGTQSTQYSKESQELNLRLRTVSAPDKMQPTKSSSTQLPQDHRTRVQTLDTRGKGNRSGPRPPNPGESCA